MRIAKNNMSVVVGLQSGGIVYLAADTQSSGSDDGYDRLDRKLFRNAEYVIGVIASSRAAQILKFLEFPKFPENLKIPEIPKNLENLEIPRSLKVAESLAPVDAEQQVEQFFVKRVVPLMRDAFDHAGFVISDDNCFDAAFAVDGWIVVIESDWQVGIYADGYVAIGSGAQVALGSMYSTVGLRPEDRVRLAVMAASKYINTVGGDCISENTEKILGPQKQAAGHGEDSVNVKPKRTKK